MRYLLVLISVIFVHAILAQTPQSFIQHLQEQKAGYGVVTVVQDEEISALVDNMPKPVVEVTPQQSTSVIVVADVEAKTKQSDTTSQRVSTNYAGTRVRHKQRGYRIQLYSGTGSAAAKSAAKNVESKVRRALPELAVYCHFKSPRWICRVGDFATREEAQRYLVKIQKLQISSEASIVPDDVFVVN